MSSEVKSKKERLAEALRQNIKRRIDASKKRKAPQHIPPITS